LSFQGELQLRTLAADAHRFAVEDTGMEAGHRATLGLQIAGEYAAALKAATDRGLEPAHPAMLRAAQNYAVFLWGLAGKADAAVDVAKKYHDAAVDGLRGLEPGYDPVLCTQQACRNPLSRPSHHHPPLRAVLVSFLRRRVHSDVLSGLCVVCTCRAGCCRPPWVSCRSCGTLWYVDLS
jgi:hypothetical protein